MQFQITEIDSPIGTLVLAIDAGRLCAVGFEGERPRLEAQLRRAHRGCTFAETAAAGPIVERFRAYFAGQLQALDSIPVNPSGTPFQLAVWQALREIPPGETISYRELARRVGRPGAARAVGAANGQNPVPLVVPCHRVIRADGDLCGYGGGVPRKRWLLEHERVLQPVAAV
jgi:methylated-DNA-[protein]-cysteine S-methyltransferase